MQKMLTFVSMNDDSGFFAQPHAAGSSLPIELIHSSGSGWSELYRIDKDGRFRVLKALKQENRGQPLYESLLRKEYEIGYSLSHPFICEVYGFSDYPGLGHAIEMEWIDGVPLSDMLAGGGLPARDSRRLACQLCDAVSYLHTKQIVHRDIKPSNILVTHNGKNLKLIDFGLSDSDSFTMLKGAAGTASFAAPELRAGKHGDWRADIWSVGKVIEQILPSKRSVARKCMEENPGKRYSDAAEVRAALLRGPVWPWALAAVALVAIMLAVLMPQPEPALPEEDAAGQEDSSLVTDPAVIDELFMQATEMIESS